MAAETRLAPARRTLDRAREALQGAFYGTALYRVSLRGRQPQALMFGPTCPWPGDAAHGAALTRGEYRFAGQLVSAGTPPWRAQGADKMWLEEMHGFAWLHDLQAAGGPEARAAVGGAVGDWIDRCAGWHPLAWRPDVLGRRLVSWLSHHTLILGEADRGAAGRVLASLAEQARHLTRVAASGVDGAGRIAAIKGLLFTAICLPGDERRLAHALRLLEHELGRQVLADGCHVSRSPSAHLRAFRDLVEARALLVAVRQPIPEALQNAVDRMAPILRFFRHGDGGLALFNDSCEESPALIDVALGLGEALGQPPASAPHSGFERLCAQRTLVLVDVGAPPPLADAHAHAGPLSFEMSVGNERMVVNCGAHAGGDASWRAAQRATAAHSTVTVDDTNAFEILDDGSLGRRPGRVDCTRLEDEGNIWIDASHDGYAKPFGLVHRRRLYLAADGDNLRGEDSLSGRGGKSFAVRFHLHPAVRASLVGEGAGALIRLASGTGWRLRASGAAIHIAESVYLGRGGEVNRSDQIVLSGPLRGGVVKVKWSLGRIEG
ncbi:MAG: heparinase II/III family protein [Proteobacteria bacterium]|nr:heparinase II/III family protein [Pseudomonadota bacterium]